MASVAWSTKLPPHNSIAQHPPNKCLCQLYKDLADHCHESTFHISRCGRRCVAGPPSTSFSNRWMNKIDTSLNTLHEWDNDDVVIGGTFHCGLGCYNRIYAHIVLFHQADPSAAQRSVLSTPSQVTTNAMITINNNATNTPLGPRNNNVRCSLVLQRRALYPFPIHSRVWS